MSDLKKCSGCNTDKPRTAEYFYRHKNHPDGFHSRCKECEKPEQQTDEYKAKRKAFRQSEKHQAYMKDYAKKYSQTEKYKAYQSAYEKSEKRKAYKKTYATTPQRQAYYKERRESEEVKLYHKNYQRVYKRTGKYKQYEREYNRSESAKESHKKYHQTERGRATQAISRHRRRVWESSATGDYTQDQWLALCASYDYRCLACQEKKPLTVDHIIPLSRGGSNDISNIQPLCQSCNSEKGTRIIDYRTNPPRFRQLSLF